MLASVCLLQKFGYEYHVRRESAGKKTSNAVQVGSSLQCWRFQSFDLDSVCVVSNQRTGAHFVFIFHPRRTISEFKIKERCLTGVRY